jgi:hypothetical protein
MDFASHLSAKLNAAQPLKFAEYPKYISVDGKQVLVLNADDERRYVEPPEAAGDEPAETVQNLLSHPEKRGPGRPRKVEI